MSDDADRSIFAPRGFVSVLSRVFLGAAAGALLGLFELFTRATSRYILAGALAGAVFCAVVAAIGAHLTLSGWRALLAGAVAGALAGAGWSLTSGSTIPTVVICLIGVAGGALILRFAP